MSASAREARQAIAKASPATRAKATAAPGRPGCWRRQCSGLARGDAVSSPTVARRRRASLGLRRAEPEVGWAEGSATSARTLRPEQQPRSAQNVLRSFVAEVQAMGMYPVVTKDDISPAAHVVHSKGRGLGQGANGEKGVEGAGRRVNGPVGQANRGRNRGRIRVPGGGEALCDGAVHKLCPSLSVEQAQHAASGLPDPQPGVHAR